jgi:hypothetical protein
VLRVDALLSAAHPGGGAAAVEFGDGAAHGLRLFGQGASGVNVLEEST